MLKAKTLFVPHWRPSQGWVATNVVGIYIFDISLGKGGFFFKLKKKNYLPLARLY